MLEKSLFEVGLSLVTALSKFLHFLCSLFAKSIARCITEMKISKANLKRAKAKKRGTKEGATPPMRTAVMKRPRVAFSGPSTLARVLVVHPQRSPTGRRDDDEVEVIHILSELEPIPSPRWRILAIMPSIPGMVVHVDAQRRGKAPMTPGEPKEAL